MAIEARLSNFMQAAGIGVYPIGIITARSPGFIVYDTTTFEMPEAERLSLAKPSFDRQTQFGPGLPDCTDDLDSSTFAGSYYELGRIAESYNDDRHPYSACLRQITGSYNGYRHGYNDRSDRTEFANRLLSHANAFAKQGQVIFSIFMRECACELGGDITHKDIAQSWLANIREQEDPTPLIIRLYQGLRYAIAASDWPTAKEFFDISAKHYKDNAMPVAASKDRLRWAWAVLKAEREIFTKSTEDNAALRALIDEDVQRIADEINRSANKLFSESIMR